MLKQRILIWLFNTFYPIYDWFVVSWIRATKGDDAVLKYRVGMVMNNSDPVHTDITVMVYEFNKMLGRGVSSCRLSYVCSQYRLGRTEDVHHRKVVELLYGSFANTDDPIERRTLIIAALRETGDLLPHFVSHNHHLISAWVEKGSTA